MKSRISRDAKCIAIGATMAFCALSLCSWTRVPRARVLSPMAAYETYYEAAERIIEDMRMECDPYMDRYDYSKYWNAKKQLNR